jgi:Mg-chelatase subunit ChlD
VLPVVPSNDPVDSAALKRAAAVSSGEEVAKLDVELRLEKPEVVAGDVAELFGIFSIKAPASMPAAAPASTAAAAATPQSAADAPPLDIVCVIDRSGSMGGAKIELLRKTLLFVVSVMKPSDRIAIVEFDDSVSALCGLTRTTAENKPKLEQLIAGVRSRGGTDIALGLAAGIELLNKRTDRNAITSLLLLTDGQDGSAISKLDEILTRAPKRTSIHTFGFGSDHDARVMASIAEKVHGTFTYIEALADVGIAFAATLGGLSSICAVDIEARVSCVAPGVAITTLHTKFEQQLDADKRVAVVQVPDLFVGESRDIVFSVAVPKGDVGDAMTLLKGAVAFAAPASDRTILCESEPLVVARPASASAEVSIDVRVNAQRNRVRATEALDLAAQLAERNELTAASECVASAIADIASSPSKDDPLCVGLLADLNATKARLADRSTFNRDGGYAAIRHQANSHWQQRQTVSSNARGGEAQGAYGYNAAQCGYMSAYN